MQNGSEPIIALVLIQNDNKLPLQWPLQRISELHPGVDGVIRVATNETANGVEVGSG